MASSNPFRRNKQAQILGIDNPNVITSPDDVSIRSLRFGRRKESQATDQGSPGHGRDSDAASVTKRSMKSTHSGDDAASFTTSTYNAFSPEEEEENPFEEEVDDDLFDEYPSPSPLRRRRTMPEKAAQLTGVGIDDGDTPWRGSRKMMNHPSMRNRNPEVSPDTQSIPLKAQKMLGISRRGRMMSETQYQQEHSLSPENGPVAPKAQKMLGIPSNPFQKSKLSDEKHQFYGDELDQHGMMGPTNASARRKPDDYNRMPLEREYIPHHRRENGSNTDVSSLSHSSLLSSPDAATETPRSSHEATPRPFLNTDPYTIDPYRAPSPGSMEESPVSLNKPLPPRPEPEEPPMSELAGSMEPQTFELAGSVVPPGSTPTPTPQMPNPQKRRLLQQTRHAAARAMQQRAYTVPSPSATDGPTGPVELPAEPMMTASHDSGPGSQSEPVELPAREATPVDAHPRSSFRSSTASTASMVSHISTQQAKHPPPAVPPPRRGGSNRSTILLPGGIPELAEKSSPAPPETARLTRNSFATDHVGETRPGLQGQRPPPPPHRTVSAQRINHFNNAAKSSGASGEAVCTTSPPKTPNKTFQTPSPTPASSFPPPSGPPPSGKLPPTPPPPRRLASNDGSHGAATRGDDTDPDQPASPTTPRFVPPARKFNASPARLPKLQTQLDETGMSFTDQLVSALSPEAYQHHAISPSDTISLISHDSPANNSKKPSLGSIALAVAQQRDGRRPSRQEMKVLNEVVHDKSKTTEEKIDVLADLGVLQQEVDALRRTFAGNSAKVAPSDGTASTEHPSASSSVVNLPSTAASDTNKIPITDSSEKEVQPSTEQHEPAFGAREKPDPFEPPHPGVAWDPAKAAAAAERREGAVGRVGSS